MDRGRRRRREKKKTYSTYIITKPGSSYSNPTVRQKLPDTTSPRVQRKEEQKQNHMQGDPRIPQ
jgi:hypothetical protein